MVELWKDPKGAKIFRETSMSPTSALDLSMSVKPDEVDILRKRIRDLEMELIEERKASFLAIISNT